MKLLDLFCCAGGAAMGYHRAGFEVIGVDIDPQPNYPFEFHQADALTFPLDGFDAIHASPPCQGYTTMNNRHGSGNTPKLIVPVRERLIASGLPWIIENVPGAKRELISPVRLTGEQFGLKVHRARLFESNIALVTPPKAKRQRNPVAVYGKNDGRRLWTRTDGSIHYVADYPTACAGMEIDWMTWDELREAIPPAFTEYLGRQLMAHVLKAVA